MLKTIFSNKKNKNEKRVIDIPVEFIRPNPYQPRKNFDAQSLEELCESIRTYGLLQPISVRKVDDSLFELIAGERRLKASKIIGMQQIPSIIVDINKNDSAILALVENSQREELHFLEEADAYYNLLKTQDLTQDELAKRIGKSQSTISNKLRLLKLSSDVKKMIINSNISERHARLILKINDENMQLKLLNIIIEKNLSVAKTEELIQKTNNKLEKKKKPKKRFKGACKDLRIFINTIKQTVDMLNKSGVHAKTYEHDEDEFFEIKVKVNKNS